MMRISGNCATLRSLASCCVLAVILSCPAVAQDFADSGFIVLVGDANGDGRDDLLLLAEEKFTIIGYDVPFPVPVPSPVATFAILSTSNGGYYIEDQPSGTLTASSAWQPGNHEFVYGDVLANGVDEILIRALAADSVSFLIAIDALGTPVLLQNLSSTAISIDLGATGTEIALEDADGDGQADLYLRIDGLLQHVFLADSAGMFQIPDDDQTSVMVAWNTFRFALDDGDVQSALLQINPRARSKYEPALLALGPNVRAVSGNWSGIKEISTSGNFAEYTVFETIDGVQRMHIITFQKQGESWMLLEF